MEAPRAAARLPWAWERAEATAAVSAAAYSAVAAAALGRQSQLVARPADSARAPLQHRHGDCQRQRHGPQQRRLWQQLLLAREDLSRHGGQHATKAASVWELLVGSPEDHGCNHANKATLRGDALVDFEVDTWPVPTPEDLCLADLLAKVLSDDGFDQP
eukprot:TRINITY_DN49521_c0_g1_i1.p1 TRINITY_DN49521_c0_g1~~TRINITY_DN49521_c0_g1_i1.p1  ORF type:complete len:159 (+),score=29.86 TRINITY_DN49521_c0_g1_i1:124-600(+)